MVRPHLATGFVVLVFTGISSAQRPNNMVDTDQMMRSIIQNWDGYAWYLVGLISTFNSLPSIQHVMQVERIDDAGHGRKLSNLYGWFGL